MTLKRAVTFLIVSILFTVLIYYPGGLYFVNDDFIHLPLSEQGQLFQRHSFRPVHEMLLSLELFLFKKNAFGFHLVALFLHLCCGWLVLIFSKLLFCRYTGMDKDKITVTSLLSASLFLLYAFHSEAVLWILGETASLCTLFYLLSVIFYLKKEKGLIFYILSVGFFVVALFTYESVWSAPLFVILLFITDRLALKKTRESATNGNFARAFGYHSSGYRAEPQKHLPRPAYKEDQNPQKEWKINSSQGWKMNLLQEWVYPVIYCIIFFINLVLRKEIIHEIAGSYGSERLFSFDIKTLLFNYNKLIARSFLPPMESSEKFVTLFIILIAVLVVLMVKLYKKNRQDRLLMILGMGFLLFLLPVISLGISMRTAESERYLYLPSVFLCISVSYVLVQMRKWLLQVVFGIVLLYNAFYAYSNSRDYRVSSTFCKKITATVACVAENHQRVNIHHLPSQLNGALIFRMGFKEGLYWLYRTDTSLVRITDTIEIFPKPVYTWNINKTDFIIDIIQGPDSVGENRVNSRNVTIVPDTAYFRSVR
jgi:hypothetical protein